MVVTHVLNIYYTCTYKFYCFIPLCVVVIIFKMKMVCLWRSCIFLLCFVYSGRFLIYNLNVVFKGTFYMVYYIYLLFRFTVFLKYVIIIKNDVLLPQSQVTFIRFWLSCKNPLIYLLPESFIVFVDLELTWWRLFQKRVVRTDLDIYVYIIFCIISIPPSPGILKMVRHNF